MTDNSVIKKLKITGIVHETENAKTFVLEPLEGWQPEYKAGQFITLVFYTKHGEKRRSYSISSSPNEPLSITVKKVDNGEFSRLLTHHAAVGDVLYTSGISGLFVLPEAKNKFTHFIFLAAGSGIVPCYALIKTLLPDDNNKITLIYSNKNQQDTIFYESLKALQSRYAGRFQVRYLFGESNDVYNRRLSKWLLELLLQEYVGKSFDDTLFYLCGPFEYMQTIEITLRVFIGKENIIKEHFSSLPRVVIPKPPDTDEHTVTIHINGHTYSLPVQYPKSILAAAKAKGIELPYSCEAGRCSSCVATCASGKIWLAYNEVLTDREVDKGRILTCQGFPIGGDAEIIFETT
jgi:ring-1,2-phenylacetyl-CoA epoxidase subunit PaaE